MKDILEKGFELVGVEYEKDANDLENIENEWNEEGRADDHDDGDDDDDDDDDDNDDDDDAEDDEDDEQSDVYSDDEDVIDDDKQTYKNEEGKEEAEGEDDDPEDDEVVEEEDIVVKAGTSKKIMEKMAKKTVAAPQMPAEQANEVKAKPKPKPKLKANPKPKVKPAVAAVANGVESVVSEEGESAGKVKKRPPYKVLIEEAIKNLNERGGTSYFAIKKYIMANYEYVGSNFRLKKSLKVLLDDGTILQTKGQGLSGSFKLSEKAIKEKNREKQDRERARLHEKTKQQLLKEKEKVKAKLLAAKEKKAIKAQKENMKGKTKEKTSAKDKNNSTDKAKLKGDVILAAAAAAPPKTTKRKADTEPSKAAPPPMEVKVKDSMKSHGGKAEPSAKKPRKMAARKSIGSLVVPAPRPRSTKQTANAAASVAKGRKRANNDVASG